MIEKVAAVIRKFNMIEMADIVMVGVSGGPDSLALLHILKRLSPIYPFKLVAAHLNHMLREEDADRDEAHVASICKEWDIPFFSKKTDVKILAMELKVSEEEAGRRARYEFFSKLMKDIKANKLALAHHKDDRVETILHNFIRGTGPHGLRGIEYVRENFVLRPLLDFSKEDIVLYCKEENIIFRDDISNYNLSYTRNRIRHELIPYIKTNFNPNFTEAVMRMSNVIREENDFLEQYCSGLVVDLFKVCGSKVEILLELFNPLHLSLKRRLLRIAIQRYLDKFSGIELVHIDDIITLFSDAKQGARLNLPDGLKAGKIYGLGWIAKNLDVEVIGLFEYALNLPGNVFVHEINANISAIYKHKNQIALSSNPIHIDADRVQGDLIIRNRRVGDRFKPLGMFCEKKLKEFFIDWKIPRDKRDFIPLIADSCNIIWVAGYQINEDYKIKESTLTVIELEISPSSY